MAPSTKLALANALKVQLQKKFLDDITVKELVEACEINRQTFYYLSLIHISEPTRLPLI